MPGTFDFTVDNVGSPDTYTVQTPCKRLRMIEKDRTVAALSTFNVYVPNNLSGSARQYRGSEEAVIPAPQQEFAVGYPAFQAETVGVASRVFSVIEE